MNELFIRDVHLGADSSPLVGILKRKQLGLNLGQLDI